MQLKLVTAINWSLKGKLSLTTDATLHGLRQTDGLVTPQLSLKLQGDSPLFAGLWVSETKPDANSARSAELDYFVGYHATLSDQVSLSAVATQYNYLGDCPLLQLRLAGIEFTCLSV